MKIITSFESLTMEKNSLVWNYYNNNKKEDHAMCTICKKQLKNNRIANLKTHLEKVHNVNLNTIDLDDTSSSISSSLKIRLKKVKINVIKKNSSELILDWLLKTPFLLMF